MNAPRVFDQSHYDLLNRARGDVVRKLLGELKGPLGLQTAIDVGCGLGYFSQFLKSLGLDVTAIDGRQHNVDEAQRRNPDIRFLRFDAEDPSITSLGKFDLVLCFGLLYHLENPFRAIRSLYAATQKILLLEGMCIPGEKPSMDLLDEGAVEDQGLNYVAFYPSETCLIKMLYRAGFPFVYRLCQPPADVRFIGTRSRTRERTFLAAAKVALATPSLVHAEEPVRAANGPLNPWDTVVGRFLSLRSIADLLSVRIPRFLRRPWAQKREIISWYTRKVGHRN